MENTNIELYSETRTIETIGFENENTLVIEFTDGCKMRVCAASPIACFQGASEEGIPADIEHLLRSADRWLVL